MERKCLWCEREFTPQFDTDAFDATYCQNSWWASSTAGREWEVVEARLRVEWVAGA